MSNAHTDPMLEVADALCSTLGNTGIAFVEDEHLQGFAEALSDFLEAAGIEKDLDRAAEYFAQVRAGQAR